MVFEAEKSTAPEKVMNRHSQTVKIVIETKLSSGLMTRTIEPPPRRPPRTAKTWQLI
jgi:hypothetical protein